MQQIQRELKPFERQKIFQTLFFMKKHYWNIFEKNVNLHKYVKKNEKKKKTWRKNLRRIILDLKIKIHNFQENVNKNSKITILVIFVDTIEKRFVKMSNSFMFSNEKIMSITQWIIRMKNKLYVNANQFDTKEFKTMYILSQIENLTTKRLNSRMREKLFFLVSFVPKHVDHFEKNV